MALSLRFMFGESNNSPAGRLLAYLFLILQLSTASFLLWKYDVEPTLHLFELSLIVLGGFILQRLVPPSLRSHYFLLITLVTLWIITGLETFLAVTITGSVIALVAIYIRPNTLKYLLLLLLIGGMAGLILTNHPLYQQYSAAFSIIGIMYIYRLLIYLYDRATTKYQSTPIKDFSYFFLVPNMSILLIPAVDYKLFLQNHLNDRALLIHKKGVQWIALGLFHLIVYRLLYYYIVIPIGDVSDLIGFVQHAVTNYSLVIRLSGIFHIVAGILCLFGYNLPATFDNYFLASGFSDLWRRLNVYFRDFMVKVFYYPIFFKLRHWGTKPAILLTILIVFNVSWFQHSYQWFWLKGNFPIKAVDLLYWNSYGVLVAGTALYEMTFKRKPFAGSLFLGAMLTTLKILVTFLSMSFLWSLWSAPSFQTWVNTLGQAVYAPFEQYLILGSWLVGILLLGALSYLAITRYKLGSIINPHPYTALGSFWSLAMLGSLLILQLPQMKQTIENNSDFDMGGILSATLTEADEQQQIEGYYTDILHGTNLASPLAEMSTAKAHQFRNTEGAVTIFEYRGLVMRPNTSYLFKGKRFTINRWGGRDKDYELLSPPNTVRTVLTGGSFISGSGVHDEEVFDQILEDKMNSAQDSIQYEFMNFGCSSYDLVDVIVQFEQDQLAKFKPDYLFYISQGKDLLKNSKDLAQCYHKRIPIPYPYLEDIIKRSGINPDMTLKQIENKLALFEIEILEKSYSKLYYLCAAKGITPVWAYWPTVTPVLTHEDKDKVKEIAQNAGFLIIDMAGIYEGKDPETLKVDAKDKHPNPLAHRMIADELYRILTTQVKLIKKEISPIN